MPLLSVRNLNVVLGGQSILEDISFDVEPGQSFAIVGPNGAGKTVLLRALLGLVPYTGDVRWEKDARIGYVPQKLDFDYYLPISLGDFLYAKAKVLGLPGDAVLELLPTVGFTKQMLSARLGTLSFGQFQKSLIVFGLLGNPDMLFLDEATLGVDMPYESHVYDILDRLRKEKRVTIVMVSHELEIVYRYTTQVLCLNRRMVCVGSPKEALTEKTLKELYRESTFYVHHHEGHGGSV
ncbi:metal ABC transporter ATP-binding protein [Candidatus Wolfebacteria bacterium]|nr:metal ABC transporter ATP-binding protein [Candidatus Wolfebacteria bacterium]